MSKQNVLLRIRKKKALACFEARQYDSAWTLYQGLCLADRLDADARLMCGVIAGVRGDSVGAEDYCRQALALDPKLAVAHFNMGIALRSQKRLEEACQSFRRAVQLKPVYQEAMGALAHVYIALHDWSAALGLLKEIIAIWPHKAEAYCNLGTVYLGMGHVQEAIVAYEAALKTDPHLAGALNGLGGAYLGRGDFERAERCYRKCMAALPGDRQAHSNLLMLLNYVPGSDPVAVFEEHFAWGRAAEARIAPQQLDMRPKEIRRQLRVGYLSPDFREHSVASFIEPVLRHHDRAQFEVFCYSSLPVPDETTRRIRRAVDVWQDIDKLSDSDAARRIREDRLDILVDLSGHTAGGRLGIFAARPAVVQMTWMGYPNTTGLRTIDYRITDAIADPAGEDAYHSETLLRLEGCFLTYQPWPSAPEVAPSPASGNGYVTFGSFNNFSKINFEVLQLWSEVLRQVPHSRLLLKCPALTDGSVRERVGAALVEFGVAAERLELLGHTPTREEHLARYARVDIALDTFPYNGTTTTCEALWMGVPVLSLLGSRHAGRVGASLLRAAGLEDWLATTPEEFVETAREKAADLLALGRLRQSLRGQLAASQLCDAAAFTRRLEAAMTSAWSAKYQAANRGSVSAP